MVLVSPASSIITSTLDHSIYHRVASLFVPGPQLTRLTDITDTSLSLRVSFAVPSKKKSVWPPRGEESQTSNLQSGRCVYTDFIACYKRKYRHFKLLHFRGGNQETEQYTDCSQNGKQGENKNLAQANSAAMAQAATSS
jgi:hypothetical protein